MTVAPDTEANQEPVTSSKTAAAAADLGSARVLVASANNAEEQLAASILVQRGYDIVTTTDSSKVLDVLEENAVDIVLIDGDIEGGSANAIEQLRADRRYADVPVILLGSITGDSSGDSMPGIDDIASKPIVAPQLLEKIRISLRTRRSLLGMESAHSVVAALANELLAPETDVRLHTERLGLYAAQLGRHVGLSASELNAVAYGTLLHDLAKLGIAEWILLKPGPFTEEERLAMQRHTEIGERIAAPLVGANRFGPILRHHHERWDGTGYPDGLKGEAIPMGARIIGVVDAFDAMTQYRIYRQAKSVPEALDELESGRGSQFDPALVDAFIEVLKWDGLI